MYWCPFLCCAEKFLPNFSEFPDTFRGFSGPSCTCFFSEKAEMCIGSKKCFCVANLVGKSCLSVGRSRLLVAQVCLSHPDLAKMQKGSEAQTCAAFPKKQFPLKRQNKGTPWKVGEGAPFWGQGKAKSNQPFRGAYKPFVPHHCRYCLPRRHAARSV